MPNRLEIPAELDHLIEKRSGGDRRQAEQPQSSDAAESLETESERRERTERRGEAT